MLPEIILKNIKILSCPACGEGNLGLFGKRGFKCGHCGQIFGYEDGIPLLFWSNEQKDSKKDVTENIKSFYEENPFPNYDDLDSTVSLREKAQKGIFARLLDEQIPFGTKVLEVGCGTGQLSNFLATTWGRTVFGTDICLNSLKLGNKFRMDNNIKDIAFVQMNLFRPVFKPGTFDFVICNGVLHHTSDPRLGFASISKLVKKDGFIVVGLYNAYGRIPTHIRRLIFRVSGGRFKFLDPYLRRKDVGNLKKQIWFMDQYKNPHESDHTIDEVLKWFNAEGFRFINGIPKTRPFESFSEEEKLFESHAVGDKLEHILSQLSILFSGGREGGFFVMIGKKFR